MQPELSLPYIILKNKIKILRCLKSGETDFNSFNVIFKDLNIVFLIMILIIYANCYQITRTR